MKLRLTILSIVAVMAAGILVGCGSKESTVSAPQGEEQAPKAGPSKDGKTAGPPPVEAETPGKK